MHARHKFEGVERRDQEVEIEITGERREVGVALKLELGDGWRRQVDWDHW